MKNMGNPGDIFWAAAEAFRPITTEELTPISRKWQRKTHYCECWAANPFMLWRGTGKYISAAFHPGPNMILKEKLVDNWATPMGPQPSGGNYIHSHARRANRQWLGQHLVLPGQAYSTEMGWLSIPLSGTTTSACQFPMVA
jgi:hypothetical protein